MKNYEYKNAIALIPVRAGSKRVENKNLAVVGGITLLERKIIQLQEADITEIYVGSDSEEYLKIAKNRGAIPIRRDDRACDESVASANQMISDFSSRIDGDKIALWCHCTNPFIYSSIYRDALNVFLEKFNANKYDSLISTFKVQSHMWNENFTPANYDPYKEKHTLAKELSPVYFQDGGIFIQKLSEMKLNSYFFGAKPYLYEIDYINSLDINTVDELKMATLIAPILDRANNFNSK